jgi:hypothetical protein
VYVLCFISLNKKILVYKTQHSSTINILTRPCLLDNLAYTAACYQIYMGGGGNRFSDCQISQKNCSDFGSGEYFTRICGSYYYSGLHI